MEKTVVSVYDQASSERPIPLRRRADLVIAEHVYRGEQRWVVKNIFSLEYFHFEIQEYSVLMWLDGQASLSLLVDKFNKDFHPYQSSLAEMQSFVVSLQEKGLLVNTDGENSIQLHEACKERRWRELQQRLRSILAYRFKGVDPERFLNAFAPRFFWLFSPWCVAILIAFILSAWLWLAMHYKEFVARIPEWQAMAASENWFLIGILLVLTKVVHELGHAICAKHLGCEVHEIGVMLLIFIPTLYCNTSDSWLLPSKWQRIAIALAGMYFEFLLMSAAVFGWWFSADDLVRDACFYILLITSIGGVFLNMNPLMRYDGYFVLADYVEIPNLRQVAETETRESILNWIFGIEPSMIRNEGWLRTFLLGYSMLAFVYRIFLVGSICFLLALMLKPIGLEVLGLLSAILSLTVLIWSPVQKVFSRYRDPSVRLQTRPWRSRVGIGCTFAIVAMGLFIPWPKEIVSPFSCEAPTARPVYVDEPGQVSEFYASIGDAVKAGDKILQLRNDDLMLQLLETEANLERVRKQIESLLDLDKVGQSLAGQDITNLRVTEIAHMKSLQILKERVSKLTIRAPVDGTVIRINSKPQHTMLGSSLRDWHGHPLARGNLGAYFSKQLAVCMVGELTKMEARIIITQRDIELIEIGQQVRLILDSKPNARVNSSVQAIAFTGSSPYELPPTLVPDGIERLHGESESQETWTQALNDTKEAGGSSRNETVFQAAVPLPTKATYPIGAKGTARIFVGNKTLYWRLSRWLSRSLDFAL